MGEIIVGEEKQKTHVEEKKEPYGAFIGCLLIGIVIGGVSGYFIRPVDTIQDQLNDINKKVVGIETILNTILQPAEQQPTVEIVIDDEDPFLGPKDAKDVVVVFSEFQCPFCAASEGYQDALLEQFKTQDPTYEPYMPYLRQLAKDGKIKIVWKDFPLEMHSAAKKAALAAHCAGDQNKFWEMHDMIFEHQDEIGNKQLYFDWAEQLDMDVPKFELCYDNMVYEPDIEDDIKAGISYGVKGTPTAFVNNVPIIGAVPSETFRILIEGE